MTELPKGWGAPSIRGVPFVLKKHSRDGGRRGPDHAHAARDLPDAEDTGAKPEAFQVEGLITGRTAVEFESARERLIAALRSPGPAWYRGPHGGWRVIIRSWSTSEDDTSLFVCRVTMNLVEAGDARYPQAIADGAALIRRSADALTLSASQAFENRFRASGLPQTVAESAAVRFLDWADASLDSALGLPRLGLTVGASAIREARAVLDTSMPASLYASASVPMVTFTGAIATAAYSIDRAGRAIGSPVRAASLFASLADRASDAATASSGVAASVIAVNEVAQDLFVRRLALAAEATALAGRSFDAAEDIRDVRRSFLARADRIRSAAASAQIFDDAAFDAVTALSQTVSADLNTRAGGLPNAVVVDGGGAPALVLAHRMYGDARRADELLTRNMALNRPLFSGTGIEALNG